LPLVVIPFFPGNTGRLDGVEVKGDAATIWEAKEGRAV
jgi:hypothetical protein